MLHNAFLSQKLWQYQLLATLSNNSVKKISNQVLVITNLATAVLKDEEDILVVFKVTVKLNNMQMIKWTMKLYLAHNLQTFHNFITLPASKMHCSLAGDVAIDNKLLNLFIAMTNGHVRTVL